MTSRRLFAPKKILISLAAIGAAAAIAGFGTFATFTSSTSAGHTVSTGTVTIALGAAGAATNRLGIAAGGLAPGDTVERSFDIVNAGTLAFSSVTLTTTASPSSLLDTDATNGLQMTIDDCSTDWTESGTAPAYTYTCPGTLMTVLASRPVIGGDLALSNVGILSPGATDHWRVTLTLPAAAGNEFQGLSSTLTYAFTARQRAASSR